MAEGLTEQQRKWFASVRERLQTTTGWTLKQWVEVARDCPETTQRKRLAWFKAEHGLGQNYAMVVLNVAFPPAMGWSEATGLAAALWGDPPAAAIFAAVRAAAVALPEVVEGQRKGFSAFSRRYQFAAARPVTGGVRLGVALPVAADARLAAAAREGWSERLLGTLVLTGVEQVDSVKALLLGAWERS